MFTLVGRTDHIDSVQGFSTTFLQVFKLLAIGEITDSSEEVRQSEAAFTVIFMVSVLVGTIVVVNLIIATLTNTYDASKKMSEQTRRKQHAALILIYEEVERMSQSSSFLSLSRLSAFIAKLPYFSFKSAASSGNLDDDRVRNWLAGRGSASTEPINDTDRELAKQDQGQNTWLHVLVEQGNNSVLWKVPRDRVLENFDELRHNLVGGKNSKVKRDMKEVLKREVLSRLSELKEKQKALDENRSILKDLQEKEDSYFEARREKLEGAHHHLLE